MEQRNFKKRVKVVVLGNAEAGKSTLIKTLIPNSINIEHGGRTIALDFGVIERKGIRFHIFGTPGQKRFDIMRDLVSIGADLFIYVFDPLMGISDYDRKVMPMLEKKGLKGIIFINFKEELDKKPEVHQLISTLSSLDHYVVSGSAKDPEIKEIILNKLLNFL